MSLEEVFCVPKATRSFLLLMLPVSHPGQGTGAGGETEI